MSTATSTRIVTNTNDCQFSAPRYKSSASTGFVDLNTVTTGFLPTHTWQYSLMSCTGTTTETIYSSLDNNFATTSKVFIVNSSTSTIPVNIGTSTLAVSLGSSTLSVSPTYQTAENGFLSSEAIDFQYLILLQFVIASLLLGVRQLKKSWSVKRRK